MKDAVASVNFAQHVLGFKVEAGTLDNPWIKGVLRQANIREREPRQSRVISAREVLLLENALIDGKMDRVDRYALGVMLFQLYSRARVSDLRNISKIELDIAGNAGYIEVQTYEHIKAGTFLPDMTRSGVVREQPEGAALLRSPTVPRRRKRLLRNLHPHLCRHPIVVREGDLDFDSLCTRETLIPKASMGVDLVIKVRGGRVSNLGSTWIRTFLFFY